MTNFHKKIFPLVLCFLTVLAACSPAAVQEENEFDNGSVQVTDETPAPTAAPTAVPTDFPISDGELIGVDLPEGIELEFWHMWSGSKAEVFEALVEEFNQTNPWGIHVSARGHGDELVLLDDFEQAWEEETLPDIVAAPSRFLRLWDQQGVPIVDLNEYLDSEDLAFSQEALDAFLPAFWKTDLDESGRRLGVPAYRGGNFLFYNQSWAQALGFEEYPRTISAFSEQACAAGAANLSDSDTGNNGTGGWIYDAQSTTAYSWLKVFTGDALVGEDGAVNFGEESSETALESLYTWYEQDCAWTGKQSDPYEYFAKCYALFYSGSSEDIFIQELTDQENGNADEWILIPYPTDEYRPVVIVKGASYALVGEDEGKNLAGWLFLRYMLAEENQVKVVEETGSLPLSTTAISLLSDFRAAHPAWDQALQYIAVAQTMPLFPEWIEIEPVFSDIAWQVRYTLSVENIPAILDEADAIIEGIEAD